MKVQVFIFDYVKKQDLTLPLHCLVRLSARGASEFIVYPPDDYLMSKLITESMHLVLCCLHRVHKWIKEAHGRELTKRKLATVKVSRSYGSPEVVHKRVIIWGGARVFSDKVGEDLL